MSKQIIAGGVAIGGGAPVTIQSMCNTKTEDAGAMLAAFGYQGETLEQVLDNVMEKAQQAASLTISFFSFILEMNTTATFFLHLEQSVGCMVFLRHPLLQVCSIAILIALRSDPWGCWRRKISAGTTSPPSPA